MVERAGPWPYVSAAGCSRDGLAVRCGEEMRAGTGPALLLSPCGSPTSAVDIVERAGPWPYVLAAGLVRMARMPRVEKRCVRAQARRDPLANHSPSPAVGIVKRTGPWPYVLLAGCCKGGPAAQSGKDRRAGPGPGAPLPADNVRRRGEGLERVHSSDGSRWLPEPSDASDAMPSQGVS
jgi:hypothetical protein